ncbi:uncharacterized protein VTP21DRAFT_725 [Calcarisporiella thermophila]|uniref:uncharacterized protein n=1 Tax=Calcarisporiella thermophila TaxID=911321 RepID=UPI00374373BB
MMKPLYYHSLFAIIAIAAAAAYKDNHSIRQVIAFGDSWTDTGNVYSKLSSKQWPPSPPYYKGRFSNGPIWVEEMTAKKFVYASLLDYAYGAATTNSADTKGYSGANSDIPVPSINQQIEEFASTFKNRPTSFPTDTTIYTIWGGGNDYYFNNSISASIVTGNIVENMQTLVDLFGANRFLILEQPPLGRLPYFLDKPKERQLFEQIALWHNGNLSANIHEFESKNCHKAVKVNLHNTYELVSEIFSKPAKHGFTEIEKPCLNGTVVCANPDQHLFWDSFHFTSKFSRILAENVSNHLK